MATLVVAAWVWAPSASGAPSGSGPIEIVGKLPVPDGFDVSRTAVDSPAGIIYEIGQSSTGWGVQIVDAETHQLQGAPIPLRGPGDVFASFSGSALPTVDDRPDPAAGPGEADHLLFVALSWGLALGARGSGIAIVDGRHHLVRNAGQPIIPTVSTANNLQIDLTKPASLRYDTVSRHLYAEGTTASTTLPGNASTAGGVAGAAPVPVVWVDRIDPFADPAPTVDWSLPVAACTQIPFTLGGMPIVRDGSLWIFCAGSTFLNASAPSLTQGVVQIQLSDGKPPAVGTGETFYPMPGFFSGLAGFGTAAGGVLGDPEGGRIMLLSPIPGPAEILVFDIGSRRVVGLMGIDKNATVANGCVDSLTGRFYVKTGNTSPVRGSQITGFLVGEARSNATPYPQVQGFPDALSEGFIDGLSCDSVRHVVIAHQLQPDLLWVVHDRIPPAAPPLKSSDPDDATTGGPYDPHTSFLSFEGDGKGFGMQLRLVGGYTALVNDFAPLQLVTTTLGPYVSPISPKLTIGASGLPDSPQAVTLSDSQVTSAAQGVARDGGLEADVRQPGGQIASQEDDKDKDHKYPRPPDAVLDPPWAYPIIACAASPGEETRTTGATGASVVCNPTGMQSTATADAAAPLEIRGRVRVIGSGSSVDSRRDKATGLLTTTTNTWAKALSIADGEIEIDNVVATATARAGGQPGTAVATYTRSIGQLVVHGNTVCAPCDPSVVATAINTNPFTQPTVRAVVPVPAGARPAGGDTRSYTLPGTAKGAQASVTRSPDGQLEDQAINEQSPYDQEVPALRLEFGNNSLQHVDLILDLAAPQAFSRLDIFPCFTCSSTDSSGPVNATSPPGGAPTGPAPEQPQGDVTAEPTDTPESAPAVPALVATEPTGPPRGAVGFSVASTPSGASAAPAPMPAAMTAPTTASGASAPPKPLPGALGQIGGGLRLALTSWSKFGSLLLVWAVMALPVYLAARRRLVVEVILGARQELS